MSIVRVRSRVESLRKFSLLFLEIKRYALTLRAVEVNSGGRRKVDEVVLRNHTC